MTLVLGLQFAACLTERTLNGQIFRPATRERVVAEWIIRRRYVNSLFMKILRTFGTIAFLVLLAACHKEEDAAVITGTWHGKQSVLMGFASGVPVPVVNETDNNFDTIVEFRDGGSLLVTDEGTTTTGTWAYTEDEQSVVVSGDLQNDFLESTETLEIQELTESALTLFLEKSGTFDVPNVGQVTGRIELSLRFDRQNN